MDIANKLESLRFLSQTHRSIFHNRRGFEWRIFFTIISFYVVSAGTLYMRKTVLSCIPSWFIITGFIGVAILAVIFLGYIHHANLINKCISENAEACIQDLINGNDNQVDLYSEKYAFLSSESFFKPGHGGAWTWLLESLIILIIATISTLIICQLN